MEMEKMAEIFSTAFSGNVGRMNSWGKKTLSMSRQIVKSPTVGPWKTQIDISGFDAQNMTIITQENLGDERTYITSVMLGKRKWIFPYGELSEEKFLACLEQVMRHNDLHF